jgi:SSS family solute:Na+ symporter
MKLNPVALSVFIFFFLLITVLGFVAARWRRGNLNELAEWGLAGRRFGTVVTWFLLGGDLYTAYTFVAVPGAVFAQGALGFFAVPYTVLVYPIIFILMPKFWSVCKEHGYVTAADFVRGRFGSKGLGLAVAFTGILATLPYIALQLFGIEVAIQVLGFPVEISLIVAFLILAAYTYTSGLRAPAMIAMVKDIMVLIVVFVAIIYIPIRLGGFAHIFAAAGAYVKANKAAFPSFVGITLTPKFFLAYSTLALGSAFALFLYPHALTSVLSSNSREVVKRNTALLPIYSLMLGLLALLGYMALALPKPPATGNGAVVTLISSLFPTWFAGFALAAISIGALVPAAVMSIAAANLFTRNIYKEYFRPNATTQEEAQVAKLVSLVVKLGALLFILFVPTAQIIQFQLLGGVWIIQTLPPVFIGLFTNWFNRWALLIGWAAGMIVGTLMAFAGIISGTAKVLSSVYALGGILMYAAVWSVLLNIILCIVLTPIFEAIGAKRGTDETSASDYEAPLVEPKEVGREALG